MLSDILQLNPSAVKRVFEARSQKDGHPNGWASFLFLLYTLDIAFTFNSTTNNILMPTSVPDAFMRIWILPRPKKVSTGHFFTPLTVGPASSNPCCLPKKRRTPRWGVLLFGGAAGIRTLATLSCPTRFRVTPLRPA